MGDSVQATPLVPNQEATSRFGSSWWQALTLVLLTLWLYAPVLLRLVLQWSNDPNFSHGFFVPAFALFVVWHRRERLWRTRTGDSWSGLPIVLAALLLLTLGVLGAEIFLQRTSLLILVAGLIILLRGWPLFRTLIFPWAFLFLMIPIPTILFQQVTFPLQVLASKVAARLLPIAGVPVLRQGNIIVLPSMPLEVAEACSGIRSLLSLVTLAIIYGYLIDRRQWVRVVLAISAIPIAVAANSFRIVGTGLLVQYWDPERGEGFFHSFSGLVLFVASLLMLFGLHFVVSRIWPDREASA